jgi:hypothetical protein
MAFRYLKLGDLELAMREDDDEFFYRVLITGVNAIPDEDSMQSGDGVVSTAISQSLGPNGFFIEVALDSLPVRWWLTHKGFVFIRDISPDEIPT